MIVFLTSAVLAEDLMVQDFGLDSPGEDDLVKPGEILGIQFDVVNVGSEDLEDITLEMWFEKSSTKLEDNNGDRINPTFNLRDIEAGDDKSVDYDLLVPWDVDEGDRYEIMVKMKGKDQDGVRFTIEDNPGSFKIEKESHELYVNASFEPDSIDCGDNVRLKIEVINIGTSDEDDVNLTAVNKLIGINVKELFYLDDNPGDEENSFEGSYPFTSKDSINPGIYELSVRAVYDGGYKEALNTISLAVENCDFSQNTQTLDSDQTQTTLQTNDSDTTQTDTGTAQQAAAQPVTTYVPAQPASATQQKEGLGTSTILLIILGEVALVAIIAVVFLALRKGRKPRTPEY